MSKKILLLSIVVVSTIALFSFTGKSLLSHKLDLTNGTDYYIDEMYITPHDSKTWEYHVELEHEIKPHDHLTVDMGDVKVAFDVLIYDNHAHKYHEYDNFKPSDLGTKWELLGDEVENHHGKPE
jgi:hypothetical protein